jgi:hypothetical protein
MNIQELTPQQISLGLIVIFIIYCAYFWQSDSFTNNERFDLYDDIGIPEPVYSKKCCGNIFQMTPEPNTDPNYNKTYFPSNLMHLGDGDTEQGCRCMTKKDIDFLSSRGGNHHIYD